MRKQNSHKTKAPSFKWIMKSHRLFVPYMFGNSCFRHYLIIRVDTWRLCTISSTSTWTWHYWQILFGWNQCQFLYSFCYIKSGKYHFWENDHSGMCIWDFDRKSCRMPTFSSCHYFSSKLLRFYFLFLVHIAIILIAIHLGVILVPLYFQMLGE